MNTEDWHESDRGIDDGWPAGGEAAGATVGGGGVTAMQNQNGVREELVTTTQGLKFALGANGVNMKLKQ